MQTFEKGYIMIYMAKSSKKKKLKETSLYPQSSKYLK